VYYAQSVQDPKYSSPEFYDLFTTRGWSSGPEIILQSSFVRVLQDHIVRSLLGKASVIADDVWVMSLAAKLSECADLVIIVFLRLLGLVGLQDIGVCVLIVSVLFDVSKGLRQAVRYLMHLFSVAFWSQLIVVRM